MHTLNGKIASRGAWRWTTLSVAVAAMLIGGCETTTAHTMTPPGAGSGRGASQAVPVSNVKGDTDGAALAAGHCPYAAKPQTAGCGSCSVDGAQPVPKDDGLNLDSAQTADGKLQGMPPVACDGADGSCAVADPATQVADSAATTTVINNPNIDGDGNVPAPCCPAPAPGLATLAPTSADAAATAAPEGTTPVQAAPVINRSEAGCASCDGR